MSQQYKGASYLLSQSIAAKRQRAQKSYWGKSKVQSKVIGTSIFNLQQPIYPKPGLLKKLLATDISQGTTESRQAEELTQ